MASEAEKLDGFFAGGDGHERVFDRVRALPRCFRRICAKAVKHACNADDELPGCAPTHCLINRYRSSSGLRWHRDIYANDGDGDAPIINLSVGASCRFGVRLDDGTEHEVRLRSGDALLFGGPNRFVKHSVLGIDLDEQPEWMDANSPFRLSFTFREAHSILGHEAKYSSFDVSTDQFEATQHAWQPGDGLVSVE